MAKLNTLKASSTSRVLLFGAPKTGKSQLAGDLAEHFNLVWIDMESEIGSASCRDRVDRWGGTG